MRKVVTTDRAEVAIQNVDDTKFYGFQQGNKKGFVSRRNFHQGNFIVIGREQLTRGNQWSGERMESECLPEMMKNLIRFGIFYEFDTATELFTWLATD